MKGSSGSKPSEKKTSKSFNRNSLNSETYVPMLNWSSNFTENNLRVWKKQMSM
jgi:hypothetical protein